MDACNLITCFPGPEDLLDPVRGGWWHPESIIATFADRIMSRPRTNGADILEIEGSKIHWEDNDRENPGLIYGNDMPAEWRRRIYQILLDNHANISPELRLHLVGEDTKDHSIAAADQEDSFVNANDHDIVTPPARVGSNLSVTLPASSKSIVNYV